MEIIKNLFNNLNEKKICLKKLDCSLEIKVPMHNINSQLKHQS